MRNYLLKIKRIVQSISQNVSYVKLNKYEYFSHQDLPMDPKKNTNKMFIFLINKRGVRYIFVESNF